MPAMPTPLIKDYADEFMRAMSATKRSPGTLSNYRSPLRCWILPEFGKLRVSAITEPLVWSWTDRLAVETGAVNRSHAYHLLQCMLKVVQSPIRWHR